MSDSPSLPSSDANAVESPKTLPPPEEVTVSFKDLGLCEALLRAVADAGYTTPTPIQVKGIPPTLKGRDVVGCAQTGTGKTAAFSLPILQHLDKNAADEPNLRVLVLTPTRELAIQIGESFGAYGKHLDIWHTVVFGGVSDKPQIREMRRGVDALIATPGRLLDLMNRGEIKLGGIEIFVLDEADRMLDMGFLPDVRRVVAKLPRKRQTLFFSATMPDEIRDLAGTLLNDPISVNAARVSAPAENVEQQVYFVDTSDKRTLLIDLLKSLDRGKTLVFSRTKHGANRIVKVLEKAGIQAAAIHGNKSQNARQRALSGFRDGDVRVLVATDIAARGIDVKGITHVINFNIPNIAETYIHRIGRTARAGASGLAISFCDTEEREYLWDVEVLVGRHLDRIENHSCPPGRALPPMTDLQSKPGKKRSRPKSKPRDGRSGGGGGRGGDDRGGRGGRPRRHSPSKGPAKKLPGSVGGNTRRRSNVSSSATSTGSSSGSTSTGNRGGGSSSRGGGGGGSRGGSGGSRGGGGGGR